MVYGEKYLIYNCIWKSGVTEIKAVFIKDFQAGKGNFIKLGKINFFC